MSDRLPAALVGKRRFQEHLRPQTFKSHARLWNSPLPAIMAMKRKKKSSYFSSSAKTPNSVGCRDSFESRSGNSVAWSRSYCDGGGAGAAGGGAGGAGAPPTSGGARPWGACTRDCGPPA